MHNTQRSLASYLAHAQQFIDTRRAKHLNFRMEAEPNNSDDDGQNGEHPSPTPPNPSEVPNKDDKGFPDNTPLADMTVEQRAAYHKHHSRKWQQRAEARNDYDEQKALADKWRAQELANQTPSEQALEQARTEARAAALAEAADTTSTALLRMTLDQRGKTAEQIDQILSTTNMQAFVVDGVVDDSKITAYADLIAAPVMGDGKKWSGTGQGDTPRGGKSTGLQAGREAFRAQRKNTT